MYAILLQDVVSNFKMVYGKEGERVVVISDHGNVLIVRGLAETFPVRKELVRIEDA